MYLGKHIDEYEDDEYECTICDRTFYSDDAILQHCRNTSWHYWCERCFRALKDLDVHIANSSAHNICEKCKSRPDFATQEELKKHCEDVHTAKSTLHNVCKKCKSQPSFATRGELEKHCEKTHPYCYSCKLAFDSDAAFDKHLISEHFYCEKCGVYQASTYELNIHRESHLPKTLECCGCFEVFRSFASMLSHIGSAYCPGISPDDLEDVANEHDKSGCYVIHQRSGLRFKCPGCTKVFDELHVLVEHMKYTIECQKHLNPSEYMVAGLRTMDALQNLDDHLSP